MKITKVFAQGWWPMKGAMLALTQLKCLSVSVLANLTVREQAGEAFSFSGRPYGFIDETLASLSRQRQLALRPLSFEVSPVHVEAVWHRRSGQASAHLWLRHAVMRATESAFTAES